MKDFRVTVTVIDLVASSEMDLPHGKEATMIDAMAATRRRRCVAGVLRLGL
jgi:hypothetical protein